MREGNLLLRGHQVSFCRTSLCIARPLPSCDVCLSVRPSVAFMYCIETSKHTYIAYCHYDNRRYHVRKLISPPRSPASLLFSVPNVMAIFRRRPLNEGVKCRWGTSKKIAMFIRYFSKIVYLTNEKSVA